MGRYLERAKRHTTPVTVPAEAHVPDVLQDAAAIDLLLRLESAGVEVMLGKDGITIGTAALSADDRAAIHRHAASLAVLIGLCDPGVLERRAAFVEQLASAAPGTVPAFTFGKPSAPRIGVCACGDPLNNGRSGRCWKCVIAWRAAACLPIPTNLPEFASLNREAAV